MQLRIEVNAKLISASGWLYNTLSMPERHIQTVADKSGNALGTWTTGAEYDAAGFNTATIYSNGRRVQHTPDTLNRVLESNTEQLVHPTLGTLPAVNIATYVYAGPGSRLIERTAGNGIRTSYDWEASGCGCGGSTSFCERVQHVRISTGEVLAAMDRRYDERGLAMVERRDDNDKRASVFRYDAAERLTSTHAGADISAGIDTYRNPANLPTVFGLKKAYSLDPRGNRTSALDSDDSGASTVYNTSYTASTDTNQYTVVDGLNYTFDTMEQMTYDPATGLYHAYDYKGQLVATDKDSNLASPERTFSYSCQGKRKRLTDSYNPDMFNTVFIDFCMDPGCGCNGKKDQPGEVHTKDAGNGDPVTDEYNLPGPDVEDAGSAAAVHPATAATPNGGSTPGGAIVGQEILVHDGTPPTDIWRFLGHDQHGSLICVTDLAAELKDTYEYADFGRTVRGKVYADLALNEISDVQADTPSAGVTTITLSGPSFDLDELAGREIYVGGASASGHVLANGGSVIYVRDTADALATAMKPSSTVVRGCAVLDFREKPETQYSFVVMAVFGNNVITGGSYQPWMVGWTVQGDSWNDTIVAIDGNTLIFAGDQTGNFTPESTYVATRPGNWNYPVNGGVWGSGPIFNEVLGHTEFYVPGVTDYMLGWTLVPNVAKPCALTITAASGVDQYVRVAGDATGLAAAGDVFRIVPPAGVSLSTGALAKALDSGANTFDDPGCMWLWSGYRYVPPQAGHEISGTTYGAQTGGNFLGQYSCWNRVYDVLTARWTTPDPAASPWTNLNSYVRNPLQQTDPSGLEEEDNSDAFALSHEESVTRYKKLATDGNAPEWYNKSPIAECPPPAKELDNVVLYESGAAAGSVANGKLEDYGKGIGVTGSVERRAVGSLDDILSALNEILHPKDCECRCVKTLTIIAHGDQNKLLLMPTQPDGDAVNLNRDAFMLGYLLKGALCPGGSINLMSCHSAEGGLATGMAFGAKATVRGAWGNIDWGSDLDKDGNPIPGSVNWKTDGVKATAIGKDDKGNAKTGDNNEDYTTDDVKGPDGKKLASGKSVWP